MRTLLEVLGRLTGNGATVVVIEHDLDMIANADHVIDMGPGGGEFVATATPAEIADTAGRCLREHLTRAAR
ncbi:hypothetical protein ACFVYA_21025 [Amycolatopsis sp. NPDC058278]|uniref:hypothetical protein n=1 Tax=Amycolatopsis sp. NPDC058278 TaxID=3346417 RepID=UPI0036DEC5F0